MRPAKRRKEPVQVALRLMGTAEAAERVGVLRSNFAGRVATRSDFPRPLAVLRCGPIWLASDIEGWLEDRNRGWLDKDK